VTGRDGSRPVTVRSPGQVMPLTASASSID
jgi:hypothetical protein